jgi:hypothetical protein
MKKNNIEAFKLLGKTAKLLQEHGSEETYHGVHRAMLHLYNQMTEQEQKSLLSDNAMSEYIDALQKTYTAL